MPYDEVMGKFKRHKLKSGGSGKTVTGRKQAIAIMLSEKREAEGGKTEYQSRKKGSMADHLTSLKMRGKLRSSVGRGKSAPKR